MADARTATKARLRRTTSPDLSVQAPSSVLGEAAVEGTVFPYRFSDKIRAKLRPCFRRDNWHAPLALLEDWGICAAVIWLSLWAWEAVPLALAVGIYFVAIVIIGSRQRALATLLHDGVHGILAQSKWLSYLIGTFGAGYLILQSFSGYHASHVKNHHKKFGDPDADPDYRDIRSLGLYGEGISPANVRSYLVSLLYPTTALRYIRYLLVNRILSPQERRGELAVRTFYVAALVGVSIWSGWWSVLLAYWLVPFLTTANWVGALIELVEHYPLMETAPKINILMSRNRLCNFVENVFLGIHNEGFHLIHHMFPGMPSWHYPVAHEILLGDEVYAALHRSRGWYNIIKSIATDDLLAHTRPEGEATTLATAARATGASNA